MANNDSLETTTEEQILSSSIQGNESALGEPEPWEMWETSLCLWSLLIGIGGLIVLGVLINMFLL